MPIFEYACRDCGQNFEELVFSQQDQVHCPQCDSASVQKQLSTFGVGALDVHPACPGGACGLPPSQMGCSEGGCSGCMHK
ncbi:MAG: zinc ribbon domain-containing protein [Candidatus Omnitrophica bacterium]|nr:zinc ribbon domain-containing protein [Candidatus Omnitrophota bacterium]